MRMLGIIATQWEWVEQLLGNAIAEIMEHKPDRVATRRKAKGFVRAAVGRLSASSNDTY